MDPSRCSWYPSCCASIVLLLVSVVLHVVLDAQLMISVALIVSLVVQLVASAVPLVTSVVLLCIALRTKTKSAGAVEEDQFADHSIKKGRLTLRTLLHQGPTLAI